MSGFAFKVTPGGGMRLESPPTPHGQAWAEWDAADRLVGEGIDRRAVDRPQQAAPARATPAPALVTPADLRLAADRLEACQTTGPDGKPCPELLGVGVLTVNCRGCGCAGLSLRTGVCKLNKWRGA